MTDQTPTRTYVDALRDGRLQYMQCGACQQSIFYPRVVCPHCGSTACEWKTSTGQGTVYSATEFSGRDDDGLRNIILVDLDEGFRLASTLDGSRPRIGQRVAFAPELSGGDRPRPVFVADPADPPTGSADGAAT